MILYEVARDEIALRQLTRQWFQRSALLSVLKEAQRKKVSVILTSDHGSIHCQTPATVFAKRDATANLRYKFGEDLRAERPEHALLFPNEDALRQLTLQWFQRSPLLGVLREAARTKVTVLLTSDHGSIHCNTPATVYAKRDATANLRYKFGEDLRAANAEQALLFPNADALRLPRHGPSANTLLAAGDTFFVYPTKLREYQGRYRGSFLHGGVTPEEVVLPLSLLTPRR